MRTVKPRICNRKSIASLPDGSQAEIPANTGISSIFLLTVGAATLSKKNLAGTPVFIGLSTARLRSLPASHNDFYCKIWVKTEHALAQKSRPQPIGGGFLYN
jgi:hypothetical protein